MLCMNHMTISFLVILIFAFIVYASIKPKTKEDSKHNGQHHVHFSREPPQEFVYERPSIVMRRDYDVFLNPYTPPERTNPYLPPSSFPIGLHTSQSREPYTQVGILTSEAREGMILPLFGRAIHRNRNKWNYYTMADTRNNIKLPVSRNGRSCTQEYGCDEIYNGDSVYVEGYKDAFTTTIYDTMTL
jgi:hypothetical protein